MDVSRKSRNGGGTVRAAAGAIALALAATALAPASATPVRKAAPRPARTLTAPGSLGSFTPASADPRLAASFARAGFEGGAFRFTPSSTPGGRKAVTVAVRAARTLTKQEAERTAMASTTEIAPTAYNLGVSLGWKRFAISGDVARIDLGPITPGSRESADVGVSFLGRRWSTSLKVGADRPIGEVANLLGEQRSYSADLSGSYALGRDFELTGGVRYRLSRDRFAPEDDRRDSQAVYVGTAFKF